MILADKIITNRKKNGWSQEEFAEKMNVSRQAVSKWEQGQSVPDLDKILLMASIFGVTTDYLLKDDVELTSDNATSDADYTVRRVSLIEANDFLEIKEKTRFSIAIATVICIVATSIFLWLNIATEAKVIQLSEDTMGVISLCLLIGMVSIAVVIYVATGFKTSRFEFLEKEEFELEYGVESVVRKYQEEYQKTYAKGNIVATLLCILSVIPFLLSSISNDDFLIGNGLTIMILIVSVAVFIFIMVGIKHESFLKLLQESEYSKKRKKYSMSLSEAVGGVYWLLIVAVYLYFSFTSNDWHKTWIIWPVAGVLFAAIMIVTNWFDSRKQK